MYALHMLLNVNSFSIHQKQSAYACHCLPMLFLDGKELEFVGSWKHLGHIMCYDMRESLPICV